MANNLQIQITATLNKDASSEQIQRQLNQIAKDLKLNVALNVDDKILNTLNNFTKQFEKISEVAKNTGKVIRENIFPDGSRVKITSFDGVVGEIQQIGEKAKKSKDEARQLVSEIEQLGNIQRRVSNQNASGDIKSGSVNVGDAFNNTTYRYNQNEEVTSSRTVKNLRQQEAEVEKLKQKMLQLNNAGVITNASLGRMTAALNGEKTESELNRISQVLNRVQDSSKIREQNAQLEQQIKLYQRQAELQATNLTNNPNKILSGDQQTGLQNYLNSVRELNTQTPDLQNRMRELSLDYREISTQAQNAGTHTLTFGSALRQALAGFSLWSVTAQLVYAPVRALQDMSQRLVQIDTQMTQIRRVMDLPDSAFNTMLQDAVNISDQLSTKLTDVLNIMSEFGKSGNFTTQQLNDMTETVSTMQNISDINSTDAVNTIVSAMTNFNVQAKDSIDIVNKLNEVDNKYAITTKDLSDSIRKAGSTAKTFGVSLDELNGYTAAIGQTTRETGSVIGNGLKTIFSRITTNDSAISALKDVNVEINNLDGSVKPVSQILGELAGKWDTLTDAQKQNTGIGVAGTYQLSRFLALLNNWDIATQATTTSINSQGSAMREQLKYQDSLQARINRLDTAWNNLVISFGQSFANDSIISLLTILTSLTNTIATVTKYTGALPPIFGLLGVTVVALSTKFRTFSTALIFGTEGMTRAQLASAGLSATMNRAGIATVSLTTALRGLASATVVGLVFVGIGIVLDKLMQAYSGATQKAEEFKAAQQKATDALSPKNESGTQALIDQYNQLNDARQKAGGKLDTEGEQKYLQVQQQLADLYPQLIDHIDASGQAHLKSKNGIDKEIQSTKELIKLQQESTKDTALKSFQDTANQLNGSLGNLGYGLDKQIKLKKEQIQQLEEIGAGKGLIKNDVINEEKQNLLALQQQWYSTAQQINANVIKISEAYNTLNIDPAIQQNIENFINSLDFTKLKPEQLETLSVNLGDLIDKVQQAYDSGDKDNFTKAESNLVKYINKMNGTKLSVEDLGMSFDSIGKQAQQMASALYIGADGMDSLDQVEQQAADDGKTLDDVLKDATSTVSDLNGILEDYNKTGQISSQTIMDLVQKYPELLSYIGNEADFVKQVQVLRDNEAKTAEQILAKKLQDNEAFYNANLDGLKQYFQQHFDWYDQDLKQFKTLAELKADVESKLISALAEQWGAYYNQTTKQLQVDNWAVGSMSPEQADGIAAANKQLADFRSTFDNFTIDKVSLNFDKIGTSIDKTSSSTEKSIYVTDKYKQSMDQLTTALEKLKNLQQQYPNYSKAYRDALQQEISLLQQQKDLTDAQAKNLQSQISSGIIQQTGMIKSSSSGSSSSTNTANYASGGSTQAQIWNFLKGKGLSDSAIAGIMGNLQQESGFKTTAQNPNGAYGLAQWMGGRLSNLKSQQNSNSLDTQLNFLWSEWAPMMSKYGASAFNNLNASQAAYIFEKLFERSGGSALATRESNANKIYSQFAGSSGTPISSSNTSDSSAEQAQAVDQAKSDLLQLQQTSSGLQSQIQDIYLQMVQSQAAYYDHIKSQYDTQLAEYDYIQNVQDKNSLTWMQTQMKREEAYNQQIKVEQDSIDYLKQQISYNNQLNEAQKATLSDDVLQRQQEVLSIEQKLFDTRSQMANDILDTYKQALQDMKDASTKSIDDMINEINKEADKADYQKKLSDAQKSAQDIQDEINKLMLDDSTAAKKRISDLQKQLSDQNDSISQMISDNNKQTQIDNLNAQKDAVSSYYDNMLNDEEKFSQMRSDILNINNQNIIDSLNSLSTQVQQNVNILGTSVVNTLIDAINRANGYMIFSNQNSGTIGHIASLDSGGVTPKFSGGKLAVLHQEEMISNKVDTNNFLESIKLVKDMVTNIFKPMNLNGVLSPAPASGNNYYVSFNVDKMNGNQNDVNNFITKFVNGIKSKGGDI